MRRLSTWHSYQEITFFLMRDFDTGCTGDNRDEWATEATDKVHCSNHVRALLALWFQQAQKLCGCPISAITSSLSWRKILDSWIGNICGTVERILSCRLIPRPGLRNHPNSLGHADGHDQRAHQARGDPGAPPLSTLHQLLARRTRLQPSLGTAPAPIVEYLSAALLTQQQLSSWSTFFQRLVHSRASGVCFTRARRGGLFSSCQRHAAPALVLDYIAQFTHLTCLCVHFPCVCGAHSTGTSRRVHQRLLGVTSLLRLRYVLLLRLSWSTFLHLQQVTRHMAIQAETFSVCMSQCVTQ